MAWPRACRGQHGDRDVQSSQGALLVNLLMRWVLNERGCLVGGIAVKNDKAGKRRKRLDHKRQWQAEKQRRAQYPDFTFDEREGTSEFMELVKDAVRRFDFNEVSPGEQQAFRDMNERGFGAVLNDLQAGMRMAQQIDPKNREAKIADLIWAVNLASAVFRK